MCPGSREDEQRARLARPPATPAPVHLWAWPLYLSYTFLIAILALPSIRIAARLVMWVGVPLHVSRPTLGWKCGGTGQPRCDTLGILVQPLMLLNPEPPGDT